MVRIIGALLLGFFTLVGLSACSAIKIGYNNLPELSYWWLDGYLDFDGAQTPKVRDELAQLLAWHRRNELPRIITLLQKAQAMAPQDITPAQACEFGEAIRLRLLALAVHAEPAGTELALSLGPAQLDQLQRKYAKVNAEYRSDWIDKSVDAQHEKRYDQWLDRSEDFYGRLDSAQRDALKRMAAESVFSPQMLDAERKKRQREALTLLRGFGERRTAPDEARLAIHKYVLSIADPPPGRWRDHQQALWNEGCRNIAALHNSTTAAQREQAVRRLRAYEMDLGELSQQ